MKIPFTCEGTLNQLKSAARILCQFWMGWSTVQEAKIFNLKQELCTLHLHVKQHQRLWYKVDRTLWFLHHLKISVTFNLLHHIITWWKIPKFHTFVIRPWHKHMVIELQACDSIRMITKGEKSLSRFQTPYLQGFVITSAHNLPTICLKAPDNASVSFRANPINSTNALACAKVPELQTTIQWTAEYPFYIELKTRDCFRVSGYCGKTISWLHAPHLDSFVGGTRHYFLIIKLHTENGCLVASTKRNKTKAETIKQNFIKICVNKGTEHYNLISYTSAN